MFVAGSLKVFCNARVQTTDTRRSLLVMDINLVVVVVGTDGIEELLKGMT